MIHVRAAAGRNSKSATSVCHLLARRPLIHLHCRVRSWRSLTAIVVRKCCAKPISAKSDRSYRCLNTPENGLSLSGTRIYSQDKEKWKFFSDFLFDYSKLKFGKEWLDAQNAASTEGSSSSLCLATASLRLAAAPDASTRWHLRRNPKRPDGRMQQLLLRSLHR